MATVRRATGTVTGTRASATGTRARAILPEMCACGASGCVIYPGLQCDNLKCEKGAKCEKSIATKVFFDPASYTDEIRVFNQRNQILKIIDKNEKYFLSSYKDCNNVNIKKIKELQQKHICNTTADFKRKVLNSEELKKEKEEDAREEEEVRLIRNAQIKEIDNDSALSPQNKEIKKNNLIYFVFDEEDVEREKKKIDEKKNNYDIKAINFSYLGNDMASLLASYSYTEKSIKDLLKSIGNLFKGLLKLNKNQIYHCDIKPQNIVFDEKDHRFKLIDFGLAIFGQPKISESNKKNKYGKKETVRREKENEVTKGKEGLTPAFASPEFFLYLVPPYFKHPEDTSPTGEITVDAKNVYFNQHEYLFDEATQEFIMTMKEKEQTMPIADYATLTPAEQYSKNDIWSMGFVLKFVLIKIRAFFNGNSTTYIKKTSSLGKKTSSPTTKTNKRTKHDIDFYSKIILGLSKVINQLLILDVKKRPLASRAYYFYYQFLNPLIGADESVIDEGEGEGEDSQPLDEEGEPIVIGPSLEIVEKRDTNTLQRNEDSTGGRRRKTRKKKGKTRKYKTRKYKTRKYKRISRKY